LIIIKYTTINELLIKSIKSKLDSIYLSIGEPTKDFDYSMTELVDILSIKNKLLEIFSSRKPLLTSNQIRILVVEDEQINRIVIEKVLRQLGYKYITLASNGDQALKLYSADPENYSILLIDIRMPLMTGFELADKIHDINPSAKMIGVTAQVVIEDDIKPWFKEFIYKPIDFKELDKKIKELVKFEF
jgi:CheY-like chemotaxis protein